MGRRIDPSWGGPIELFLVLHDWCNKGRGMCYPVCGMMHIKEPLLLIGKSSPCGGSGFPLSLYEWSFTICPTPYTRKWNVLSASLNKTLLPSFLPCQCFYGSVCNTSCFYLNNYSDATRRVEKLISAVPLGDFSDPNFLRVLPQVPSVWRLFVCHIILPNSPQSFH